ncbi:MAG: N-acetylglucosamine-6-phosphate deacetylase [Candidatus Omnitrophica bacterium]|nr:N-acetylglucosamine-6-phosphate deacetylase [Candidatus Omnitrophota bacterium]
MIKNGRVILKDRIVDGATVEIAGSKIVSIGKNSQLEKRLLRRTKISSHPPRNDEVVIMDAKGCFVSPGFIDCHIHGEPKNIFSNEARHGTTAFVIAESCAPLDHIYKRAEGIKEFIGTHPFGPNVLGLRLEGPYISKSKAGAQDPKFIRSPDAKELSSIIRHCLGLLKIMTIAPELSGAKPLIKLLRQRNIIASVGHSDATYESAVEGIDAGIIHSTHTFNAMSHLDRREPGVVGAVLTDDRVAAEVILDLIHVHRALFGLLLKLKKSDKVIVVTDSLAALDYLGKNGDSPLRGQSPFFQSPFFAMTGGAYRFEDGRLAGSSLTMIGALKNAVKSADLPLEEALNTITINPAKLLGVEDNKGSIAAGKDADIVIFDKEFNVKTTIIRGKIAYRKSL